MSDDSGTKRRGEFDFDGENKKQRKGSDMFGGDSVQFRAIIKSMDAGAIIGRGGENIKRLRSQFDTEVGICGLIHESVFSVLQISGDVDKICEVILEIVPLLDDYKHHDDLEFDAEMRMLVVAGYVGAIMGSGGSKIKTLREDTGAAIKVYEDCCPGSNERVFRITCKPVVLVEVVKRILAAIRDAVELRPREGAAKLYDPNFVDPPGGGPFSPPMRSSGPRRGGGGYGPPSGNSPPRGGPGGMSSRLGAAPPRMSRTGVAVSAGGLVGGPPSYYDSSYPVSEITGNLGSPPQYDMAPVPLDPMEETRTIKVSIRNEEAGAVIGQRGSTINRVRERSGATIKIDDGRSGGNSAGGGGGDSKHRIITITGTEQQIQFAQYLMQQSVKQDQGRVEGGGSASSLPRNSGTYRNEQSSRRR